MLTCACAPLRRRKPIPPLRVSQRSVRRCQVRRCQVRLDPMGRTVRRSVRLTRQLQVRSKKLPVKITAAETVTVVHAMQQTRPHRKSLGNRRTREVRRRRKRKCIRRRAAPVQKPFRPKRRRSSLRFRRIRQLQTMNPPVKMTPKMPSAADPASPQACQLRLPPPARPSPQRPRRPATRPER